MSSMLTAKDTLISIGEAANILEWPRRRVYAAVRAGKFEPGVVTVLGRARIRFVEAKLRLWKQQHEQLLTVVDAGRLLEACPTVVRAGVRSGLYTEPMVVRKGARIFFNRNELLEWITSGGSYRPTQQEIERDFNAVAERERQRRANGGYDGRQQ